MHRVSLTRWQTTDVPRTNVVEPFTSGSLNELRVVGMAELDVGRERQVVQFDEVESTDSCRKREGASAEHGRHKFEPTD